VNLRDQLIRWWIRRALKANNALELQEQIRIEWSNRFRRSYGNCSLGGKIRLSTKHWRKSSTDENRDTVMHECCHLIAMRNAGHDKHGEPWQQAMTNAGLDPHRIIPYIEV